MSNQLTYLFVFSFSESYFTVKGAALILPQSDYEAAYTRKTSKGHGGKSDPFLYWNNPKSYFGKTVSEHLDDFYVTLLHSVLKLRALSRLMDCPRVRDWTSGMILLELQVRVISPHGP